MFPAAVMSNSTSLSEDATAVIGSSGNSVQDFCGSLNPMVQIQITSLHHQQLQKTKKKRNLPGNPDPNAEVIALSPKTLLATNRFLCEICNKGFQREQNLQLHRRGHNLPWKLKQRNNKENKKKVYVCPENTCVHHHPSRSLGDLSGIKKHYSRKHGEKKWKCDKCSKIYAVQSDWKAHSKICGTREYRCDCGTVFSRKDSFITHRAFCDALAEESARLTASTVLANTANPTGVQHFNLYQQNPSSDLFPLPSHQRQYPFSQPPTHIYLKPWEQPQNPNPTHNQLHLHHIKQETTILPMSSPFYNNQETPLPPLPTTFTSSYHLSPSVLFQKASSMGTQSIDQVPSTMSLLVMERMGQVSTGTSVAFSSENITTSWQKSDRLTRDFLGLTGDQCGGGGVNVDVDLRNLLSFTGGVELPAYENDQSLLLKHQHCFGFAEPATAATETWGNC